MANATTLVQTNIARYVTRVDAAWAPPANYFAALLKPGGTSPEDGNADSELTTGEATSYTRKQITWEASVGTGIPRNAAAVTWTAGGNWPQVDRIAICASNTVGADDVHFYLSIDPVTLGNTDTLSFAIGEITLNGA